MDRELFGLQLKITSSWVKDGNAIPFLDFQEADRWSSGKCREEPRRAVKIKIRARMLKNSISLSSPSCHGLGLPGGVGVNRRNIRHRIADSVIHAV